MTQKYYCQTCSTTTNLVYIKTLQRLQTKGVGIETVNSETD